MSHNKSQISPIPPEGYGDRFIKFISGITMTKEEQDRQAQSGDQTDGSIDITRQPAISRKSTDKVVEKAEKQAHKKANEGAIEEPPHDKTLSAVRSPSKERGAGMSGATLPVVEEDGEAGSTEDSVQNEKFGDAMPPPTPVKDNRPLPSEKQLPSLPNFNRLSLGMSSLSPEVSRSESTLLRQGFPHCYDTPIRTM